ncbi:hypothetical protein [Sinobaca sp. H24]|uniref:hypothetical protein n=1 Tax=Sinobaca sp. H24 TaxID=2923376 RepID=UPI00207946E8|nr:hypothetical protein [Sinobaca sp. H24]
MNIIRYGLRATVLILAGSLFFVDVFMDYSSVYQTLMGFVVLMFLAKYEKDRSTMQPASTVQQIPVLLNGVVAMNLNMLSDQCHVLEEGY